MHVQHFGCKDRYYRQSRGNAAVGHGTRRVSPCVLETIVQVLTFDLKDYGIKFEEELVVYRFPNMLLTPPATASTGTTEMRCPS
jgi:hypothetical protein